MPTEDGFAPDEPLPLFLSGHDDEREPRGAPLLLNARILVITTTLIGCALALWLGHPAKVFADITASLTGPSTSHPEIVQATVKNQSTADARALPTSLPATATRAPTRDDIAAAFDGAAQKQAETSEAPSALLQQFQAWAARQDDRVQVKPPVEDVRAQVEPVPPADASRPQDLQDAQAPARSIRKHRKTRSVQNARAEMRPPRNPRPRLLHNPNVPVDARPTQEVRAQDQSVQGAPIQGAQGPSFLQNFGWHQ